MTKFKSMVKDSINQEELANVFGGDSTESSTMVHACDSKACSSNTTKAANLCTYGDGVCSHHVA